MADWGVTARESSWKPVEYGPDLGDIAGWRGHGFVRDVAAGVKYVKPPEIEGLRTWVRRSTNGRETFVMTFSGEAPPATETFLDLQKRLAAKRNELKDGDQDLERLDRCIDQFLSLASRLHQRQIPLGFVQPRSVLFCSDPEVSISCQLPDLGFVFDVAARVMGRPAWLGDAGNVMFDSSARDRNKSYLDWAHAPSSETFQALATADVGIAARLICFALVGENEIRRWCGDGRPLAEVPPPADGLNDTACRAVWDVLHRGVRGELHSLSELRELLTADARPSRHFLERPPQKAAAIELWLRRSALPVAAAFSAILVAGAAVQAVKAFAPRKTAVCNHVSSWNKSLFPPLESLAAQSKSAAASSAARQQFLDSLKSYVLLLRASPRHECDESCTERLLATTESWIDDEVQELLATLKEQPRQNREEVAILSAKKARIDELSSLRRESSQPLFQAASQRLDRQLLLRGATAASPGTGSGRKVSP
jgi:hypothetical protein